MSSETYKPNQTEYDLVKKIGNWIIGIIGWIGEMIRTKKVT